MVPIPQLPRRDPSVRPACVDRVIVRLIDGQRDLSAGLVSSTPQTPSALMISDFSAGVLHVSPDKLDERPQSVVVVAILFLRERERRLDDKDVVANWIWP